jgi:phosphatidylglycerol:prolipoprotein diacylglycerol transferase
MIGAIIVVIMLAKFWHLSVFKLLDLLAIGSSIGGCLLRIGCFFNGCCRGRVSGSLWGIRYPDGPGISQLPTLFELLSEKKWFEYMMHFDWNSPPVHPAVLYYSVGFLVIFVFLCVKYRQIKTNPGNIGAIWLFLHGILRFLIEMIRDNPPYIYERLNLSGIVSIASVVVGIIAIMVRWGRHIPDNPPCNQIPVSV